MSIEFKCEKCAAILRVPADAAGHQTRCPKCGLVQLIPAAVDDANDEPLKTSSSESSGPASEEQESLASRVEEGSAKQGTVGGDWYIKTPDESKYGPATFDELQQWVKEGRVISGCWLREPGSLDWQDAEDYFPNLPSLPEMDAKATAPENFSRTAVGPNGPMKRAATEGVSVPLIGLPPQSATDNSASGEPHRAGVVLTLGILGLLFTCPLFSLIAWSMGASDLKKMDNGQMDPRGREMTYSGYVLGKLFSIILLIGITIALLIYGLSAN